MKKTSKQAQRLAAARGWLPTYTGKNIARGYRKHFGVDYFCTIREIQMLGQVSSPEYIKTLTASILVELKARQEKKERREKQRDADVCGVLMILFVSLPDIRPGVFLTGVVNRNRNCHSYKDRYHSAGYPEVSIYPYITGPLL